MNREVHSPLLYGDTFADCEAVATAFSFAIHKAVAAALKDSTYCSVINDQSVEF